MIGRSIVQYLANHDRRKESDTPALHRAHSAPSAVILDLPSVEIDENDAAETEPGAEADLTAFAASDAAESPAVPESQLQEQWQQQFEEQFQERLRIERETWVAAEANRIDEELFKAFQLVEANICDQLARILQPFLHDTMTRSTIKTLCAQISALTEGQNGPILQVSGPKDMLSALQSQLGERQGVLVYDVADSPEVRVISDSLLIETHLAEWAGVLRAVFEGGEP